MAREGTAFVATLRETVSTAVRVRIATAVGPVGTFVVRQEDLTYRNCEIADPT